MQSTQSQKIIVKNFISPNFFPCSRNGLLYQITPFYDKQLNIKSMMLSLGDFYDLKKTMQKFSENNLTLKKYLGLDEERITYLSPIDYYKPLCIEGLSAWDKVKLFTNSGMKQADIGSVHEVMELIQSDITVQMTEFSTGTGVRSMKRSIEKSQKFLQEILKIKNKFQLIFGACHGGLFEELRVQSIQNIMNELVDGFVIYGLGQGEHVQERQLQYDIIKKNIPEEKQDLIIVSLSGVGDPLHVLHGLINKVDLFETEFPFKLAEQGQAWIYNGFEDINQLNEYSSEIQLERLERKLNKVEKYYTTEEKEIDSIDNDDEVVEVAEAKEPVEQKGGEKNKNAKKIESKKRKYKNIIIDKCHYVGTPIDVKCGCSTCQNYTKAYILHLLEMKEMTANVLLCIHNFFTYQRFFQDIQMVVERKMFNQYFNFYLDKNTESVVQQ